MTNQKKIKIDQVTLGLLHENCYLAYCETTREGLLVDPGGHGLSEDGSDSLKKEAEAMIDDMINRNSVVVKNIILTHAHCDHVVLAGTYQEKLKVDIIGPHKADEVLVVNAAKICTELGLGKILPFKPKRYLQEGEKIQFGDCEFEIFETPGHSPGSLVYYNKNDNLAIVGDVIFKSTIGRTDLALSSHKDLINSIRNKVFSLDANTILYPGHGAPTTIKEERVTNNFVKDVLFDS